MKNIIVENSEAGERADNFLSKKIPSFSRSRIQKGIVEGKITLVGKSIKSSYKVCISDKFKVSDKFLNLGKKILEPKAENISLEISYEDDNVLVVNKPAGIVVHPANGNEKGTLVNALINYNPSIFSPTGDGNVDIFRPGIVHRLDKDTSGVLLVAKNIKTKEFLSNEFKKKNIEKTYIALVFGHLEKRGSIKSFLGRNKKHRKTISEVTSEKGKLAITNFKSIKYFSNKSNQINLTLAEIKIPTGRTHQIRTQLKSIGHPIIGDQTYNIKESQRISNLLSINRQLLHAKQITFHKPFDKKIQSIDSSLPNDFRVILDKIEKYLVG